MKRRKSKAFLAIVFSAALWPLIAICCRFMLKAEHILPLRVVKKKLNVFSSKTVVSVCCFSPDFLSLFKGVIKGKGAFL